MILHWLANEQICVIAASFRITASDCSVFVVVSSCKMIRQTAERTLTVRMSASGYSRTLWACMLMSCAQWLMLLSESISGL